MMDQELYEEWIDRLVNPESEQAFGSLRGFGERKDCYCVAGHLVNAAKETGAIKGDWNDEQQFVSKDEEYWSGFGYTIPKSVLEVIGIEDNVLRVLMSLNDESRFSLQQLAEVARLTVKTSDPTETDIPF